MKGPVLGSTWAQRGLTARVMLLVGIGTLGAIATLGGVAWNGLGRLSDELIRERGFLARSAAERVDSYLSADFQALQGVASRLSFPGTDDTVAQALLREAYLQAWLLQRVMVLGPDGALRWQHPPTGSAPEGLASVDEFIQALHSGRPTATGLMTCDASRRVAYAMLPVRDVTGAVPAVVVGEIDFADLRGMSLVGTGEIGPTASIDVADSRGAILASSDASRLFEREPLAEDIEPYARQRRAVTTTVGSGRQREVVALAPVTSAPWTVLVRQLESDALDARSHVGRTLLWLAPALLGFTLLFAWGAARSVRSSLGVLARAAARIAEGNLGVPIPRLPEDEVGILGRSLDRMRLALKQSIEQVEQANQVLEQRVADRTSELARLNDELREREAARGELLRKVITAQEDERRRIARELHDETSQSLSALAMSIETAAATFPTDVSRARLADAKTLTLRTLEELHRLILDLRPSVLDDLGLLSAIRWSAERHLERRGIAYRCEMMEDADLEGRLIPEIETALFRVVQEAITNIARHSKAESVLIQVEERQGQLAIEIEDDGEGFEIASLPPPGSRQRGLGLLGMRERVELAGGRFSIESAPGQGTRLLVMVPLSPRRTP